MAAAKKQLHIPYISKDVEDILLWRNPKQTGIVFGGITVAFLAYLLNPFSASTIIFYAIAISSAATFLWAQMGNFVSKSGPPVPTLLTRGISEGNAQKFVDVALPIVNKLLAIIGVLAGGRDFRLSAVVIFGSWAAASIFTVISPVAVGYLVLLAAFTAPKVYELKQDQIEKVLSVVKSKTNDFIAKVNEMASKIPKASPPKKAQ